jgi:hypothetical protein
LPDEKATTPLDFSSLESADIAEEAPLNLKEPVS